MLNFSVTRIKMVEVYTSWVIYISLSKSEAYFYFAPQSSISPLVLPCYAFNVTTEMYFNFIYN